jgi:hypothetical protein
MIIPRQSGPEPKACSVEWGRLWIVYFGMRNLPIECDKVAAGAERREGYDIETGLKWDERAARLAIVR